LGGEEVTARDAHRPGPDWPFYLGFALLGGIYLVLILAMLGADFFYTTPGHLFDALRSPEIRYSIRLSLLSCSVTTILALWVAVPLGYLLSRTSFYGKNLVDTILDIPIVIPPLVVGLSLLILFQTLPGRLFESHVFQFTYAIPSVVLAQFAVAAAFSVRTMRVTFDQIPTRAEDVARTLGCSRGQAFWRVTFPEARRGLLTAATLAWARSLGEFGPVLIFSGATRLKTEVLPTTVFLELSVGRLHAAIAVSLLMVIVAVIVLIVTRIFGLRGTGLI
jgi:molybdate transport system permease protein